MIQFCRGRTYVNGNIDYNAAATSRGTPYIRIIKSNVSSTCAGVWEIKHCFAYFKYRTVSLVQSKYLSKRKSTETPRAKFVHRGICNESSEINKYLFSRILKKANWERPVFIFSKLIFLLLYFWYKKNLISIKNISLKIQVNQVVF